ncbi:hypothetical protein E4T47_09395 [Aureobasidium subglaciale]|nr:hypothetical protein E4T47_09395 [Aureobasidium subglaciale]
MGPSPTTVGFSKVDGGTRGRRGNQGHYCVLGPCTMMHSAIPFTVECACRSFAQIGGPLQKNHRRLNFERTRLHKRDASTIVPCTDAESLAPPMSAGSDEIVDGKAAEKLDRQSRQRRRVASLT